MPKPPPIKTPVIAIGGANMDLKGRIGGPEIRATSNPGKIALTPGGVARNVAETLARLGLPTRLIAAIGRDSLGEALMAETRASGVGMNSVLRGPFATGSYAAVLTQRGELLIGVSAMDATQHPTPSVLKGHSAQLRRAQLIMADCNLPMAALDWLVRFAAGAGVLLALETVSVPKARRLRSVLQKCPPVFALFSNRAEIAAITGANGDSQRGLARAARWLHDRGVRHVAIGLGAKGMFVSSATEKKRALVPSRWRKVVDVTGAGDAAVAGTLFGLLRGLDLPRAAICGQAAAALTVASERSVSLQLSSRALLRAIRSA